MKFRTRHSCQDIIRGPIVGYQPAHHLAGSGDPRSQIMWHGQETVPQQKVTSDGFRPYINAVEEAWGADVDFAQLIKIYGTRDTSGPGWYGPPKVIGTSSNPISGNPDMKRVSTSHVERINLSVRMSLRRFTRLTNAFSKKLTHLKAAVALFMAWYNFGRVHQSLRVTPAMEAGLTDHVWTVSELLKWGCNVKSGTCYSA